MNNISFVEEKECFGCTACMAICGINAISMMPNKEGFMVPYVDVNKCVNCGKCKSVCPAVNKWEIDSFDNHYYVFQNADDTVLKSSSSGGAFFSVVSEENPDSICGCVEDENLYIKHIVTRKEGVDAMRGSKYVQSDMSNSFRIISEKLVNGERVLFTGTSCQTHGLLNYLNVKNISVDNLLTMDLICHGAPSNLMHQEYIRYYEKSKKERILKHIFRSKRQGWGAAFTLKNYEQTLICDSGKKDQTSLESQLYINVFFSDYCLRETCYKCPYCTENKPADITMADFWGVEETDLLIDNNKGCSFLIGRGKGVHIIEKLDGAKELTELQACIAKKYQRHLSMPNERPNMRDFFWDDYYKKGFGYVAEKYLHFSFKYKLLMRLFNIFNLFRHKRFAYLLGRKIFY